MAVRFRNELKQQGVRATAQRLPKAKAKTMAPEEPVKTEQWKRKRRKWKKERWGRRDKGARGRSAGPTYDLPALPAVTRKH